LVNEILHGNCLEKLKELKDNSVDSIVTDPPYELGFMGKKWDSTGIAFNSETWERCLRVLKPGGHMLAFGGSRTFHRIAVAIEDAGFELRDTIMWVYGSGFPKSHDISKVIDKAAGIWRGKATGKLSTNKAMSSPNYERTPKGNPATPEAQMWEGWGTALKPAFEPIILARKPISEKNIAENVLKWGTGGINIDDCRVEYNGVVKTCSRKSDGIKDHTNPSGWKEVNRTPNRPATPTEAGRWPANFIHDGSEEVLRLFPETKSTPRTPTNGGTGGVGQSTNFQRGSETSPYRDSGSAARFFYCAKASKKERNKGLEDIEPKKTDQSRKRELIGGNNPYNRGAKPVKNNHPTVKPLELMKYLVRLVTPPEGIVLDPFAGSGTTLIAATLQDFKYIGIELNKEYIEIAKTRIKAFKKEQEQEKEEEAEMPLFEYVGEE
jgi:site-specific DNA-methyltransferase (adenine-specific)